MKNKYSISEKIKYWFDNIMSKGTIAMIQMLSTITFLVVVIAGIILLIINGGSLSDFGKQIWISLMHAIDPGTLTTDKGKFGFMLLMTIVTVFGLLFTSVLIGIINNALETKLKLLRKGKSRVLEKDHIVILGFDNGVYTIINELIIANENQKEGVIVIMDDNMEKEDLENAIHQRIPNTKNTKIICRKGNISDFSDLKICSIECCRSVIINTDDDFKTIKAIMATTNLLKKSDNINSYVVAVVKNKENIEIAEIAGGNRVEILYFEDIIARIAAHSCRETGLSEVFTELFDFDGDEIYIETFPEMIGKYIRDVNLYFPKSTVIGILRNEEICINPSSDTVIDEEDKLILIAEDDGVSVPNEVPAKICSDIINIDNPRNKSKIQKMLILGYESKLSKILAEEDEYMAVGSQILVAVTDNYADNVSEFEKTAYKNIKVETVICDIMQRQNLKKILEFNPECVLVMSDDSVSDDGSDTQTLFLLLQLRSIAKELNLQFNVTSEMKLIENQELAQIAEVKDFIISRKIISLLLTQISQNRELRYIFEQLLTSEGSELYMRPASDYIKLNAEVDIYTAGFAAAMRGEILIGYKSIDEKGNIDIVISPEKCSKKKFNVQDMFIVLAEN